MRLRMNKRRNLVVPSHCVDFYCQFPASCPDVFLYPSVARIDIYEQSRWLFVPKQLVLAYFRCLVFRGLAAARLLTELLKLSSRQ